MIIYVRGGHRRHLLVRRRRAGCELRLRPAQHLRCRAQRRGRRWRRRRPLRRLRRQAAERQGRRRPASLSVRRRADCRPSLRLRIHVFLLSSSTSLHVCAASLLASQLASQPASQPTNQPTSQPNCAKSQALRRSRRPRPASLPRRMLRPASLLRRRAEVEAEAASSEASAPSRRATRKKEACSL